MTNFTTHSHTIYESYTNTNISVLDYILASAATNGAVCTWNLNKSSRSKQGKVSYILDILMCM